MKKLSEVFHAIAWNGGYEYSPDVLYSQRLITIEEHRAESQDTSKKHKEKMYLNEKKGKIIRKIQEFRDMSNLFELEAKELMRRKKLDVTLIPGEIFINSRKGLYVACVKELGPYTRFILRKEGFRICKNGDTTEIWW